MQNDSSGLSTLGIRLAATWDEVSKPPPTAYLTYYTPEESEISNSQRWEKVTAAPRPTQSMRLPHETSYPCRSVYPCLTGKQSCAFRRPLCQNLCHALPKARNGRNLISAPFTYWSGPVSS